MSPLLSLEIVLLVYDQAVPHKSWQL